MKSKIQIILVSAIFFAALADGHAQTTFTKITEGDIVNDLGAFVRGAWGDFNNDGFLDLFISDYGGTNVFYRNNGDGTFTKITQGDPVQGADTHTGPSWGDYDNDGNLDLLVPAGLVAPTPTRTLLYHNNGDGTFAAVSGGSITNQVGYFGPAACADYDNDGFLDLFIENTPDAVFGGKGLLFHNNGDGTFIKTESNPVTSDISVHWASLWADYDNDGFMDLFVVNASANGVNLLYHNNRNGTFTRVFTNAVATDRWPAVATGGAWGDYDNDGFLDLFVTTGFPGQNRLYHNNGDGTFTRISSDPMLSPPADGESVTCVWGDYDNDGYLDLFVSNHDGSNGLFHNNGDGTFTQILSGSPVDDGGPGIFCRGPSWVDYDNDGFLDLLVLEGTDDGTPLPNLLYHNNGNTNAWLEVKCVGTVSNRSGIGAKVRVRATIAGKTFWQLREINEGGGYNNAPLVAHFGLGDATKVEVLRIEWPSGIVQEIPGVPAKQILTASEPPRFLASMANSIPQFTLKGGRGSRYQIEVSTNLTAWSPVVKLTITNLSGTAQIIDTNAPIPDRTFYRAVSQ